MDPVACDRSSLMRYLWVSNKKSEIWETTYESTMPCLLTVGAADVVGSSESDVGCAGGIGGSISLS